MNTIRTMICSLILLCLCSPLNANEWGNGWGFEPVEVAPPEAYDVFMGGILAQQQETICINGVCYPVTSTVTEWTPVTNGEVFEAPQEVSVMTEICAICGKPKLRAMGGASASLVSHLATHGIDASGMTQAEAEAAHSAAHAGAGVFARGLRPFRNWFSRMQQRRAALDNWRATRGW